MFARRSHFHRVMSGRIAFSEFIRLWQLAADVILKLSYGDHTTICGVTVPSGSTVVSTLVAVVPDSASARHAAAAGERGRGP